MQQAVEAMKRSRAVDHNRRDGSDLRSGRRGLNVTERRRGTLEISAQRIDVPVVADIKTRPSAYLRGKLDPAHSPTRTGRLAVPSKPRRRASVPLPPVGRSRATSGKAERTGLPPAREKETARPEGYSDVMTVFHVLVARCGKANEEESDKISKIGAALAAGDEAAVQDREAGSRRVKWTSGGQPARRKKNEDGGGPTTPVTAKHDTSVCEARRQRDLLCSGDSDVETEPEGSGDKGRPERPEEDEEDEYYTNQRITEWVLEVNSSSLDEERHSKPTEEQDVGTIKIIYSGD